MNSDLSNHWIYSNFDLSMDMSRPCSTRTISTQTDRSYCLDCIERRFFKLHSVAIDSSEVDEYLKLHPLDPVDSSADILEVEPPDIKPSISAFIVLSSDDENNSLIDTDPPNKRLRTSPATQTPIKSTKKPSPLDQARMLKTCITIRSALPETSVSDRKTRGKKSPWANELTARLIAKLIRNNPLLESPTVNEHIIYILTHIEDLKLAVRALAVIFWGGDQLSSTQIPPPNQPNIKSELPLTQEFHEIWKDILVIARWDDENDEAVKLYLECIDKLNERLALTRLHLQ